MSQQQALTIAVLMAGGLLYWWLRQRQNGSSVSAGSVLETFTHDWSADAEQGKLDPVIGRDEEIERMVHILSRRTKNNPLLLGEPGVGKTAVVEGIARRIASGDVPETIKGKRVLALDLGALIGGTKYRGEFEERMKALTNDIKSKARSIILFIDEIHMVEQAKGAEGAINVSDILKPALARGDLQMIGATTWREYEQYIKKDDALDRRLQPVVVGEPSDEATLQILHGIKDAYEKHHKVHYSDESLEAAVKLSKRIQGRFLPDKAIDLIDEAGAKVSIEASHATRHALGLVHAAGSSVAQKLKQLEDERMLLERERAHLIAAEKQLSSEPEVMEIRQRLDHVLQSIELLREQWETKGVDGQPEVEANDIAQIVEDWMGKVEKRDETRRLEEQGKK